MGLPRQEYWSGLPFPTPGDLPDPGIELASPALAGGFFTTEPQRSPLKKKKKKLYSFHLFDKHLWISYTFLGRVIFKYFYSFPDGSDGKESARNAGDLGLIPGLERSPGEGNGNPLQYSCLENPMDRGAWQATVHGVTKSQTWLSD